MFQLSTSTFCSTGPPHRDCFLRGGLLTCVVFYCLLHLATSPFHNAACSNPKSWLLIAYHLLFITHCWKPFKITEFLQLLLINRYLLVFTPLINHSEWCLPFTLVNSWLLILNYLFHASDYGISATIPHALVLIR